MNKKTISIILFVFILVNAIVYKITDINSIQRIEKVLEQNLQRLKTHYEILLRVQNTIALSLYDSTVKDKVLIDILKEARYASKKKQKVLRDKLYVHLKDKYTRAKMQGVLQYQFIFPDNISFLRMHKPSKFGDDLTNIRDDFRVVNQTQKPIRVFTQGRTTHGFRNTFPIFDFDGKHIGAMEVSFSSDHVQQHLTQVSHIHTNFLVDKKIFDTKTWKRDDMVLKYQQSAEHPNYMINMTDQHTKERDIIENSEKLKPKEENIDAGIKKGEEFSTFVEYDGDIEVVSFLPIKNIENKTVAWLVSYEKSDYINYTVNKQLYVRGFVFLLSLIISYFVMRQLQLFYKLKELNSTLKQRVKIEVEKNRQKDYQILEQSRLAQMGEMISMIAHQWRQPLNSISAASTSIILKSELNSLDSEAVIKLATNISNYTQYLSSTINDFRDFFKETKVIESISYEQLINSTLNIIEDSIANLNIEIVKDLSDSNVFATYSNEVKQVLLNILKNAEDVLVDNNIQNGQIKIKSLNGVLTISDNGGGVPNEIIDKIFDPYFSTKSKNGTGLGLYMSKVIIEEHCNGSLTVSNDKDGAVFKIVLGDIKG